MQNGLQKLQKGWNESQVCAWHQDIIASGKKRNYGDIVSRVNRLPANVHTVETYGTTAQSHPLLRITVGNLSNGKPNILITCGVHGYEPSGIEAGIRFLEEEASALTNKFNFVVYNCISPWAYEYDQRWNPQAEDPNRLFRRTRKPAKPHIFRNQDIEECRHFMNSIEHHATTFACAIDLHETTNRDRQLRVLRSERFDEELAPDYQDIPQGYYLTLSKRETLKENERQLMFGKFIIDEVRKVSPIAQEPTILNGKENRAGIILSAPSDGLMRSYLDLYAKLVAVTEVYPDHPDMPPEKAVKTQLASIHGALDYVSGLPYNIP